MMGASADGLHGAGTSVKQDQTSVSKKDARQRAIVAELNANAAMRTSQLAEKLGVSAETIRRDIEELTERQMINRTYGGATGRHVGLQPVFDERTALAVQERRRIADRAAALVRPKDVLMIDSGSTTTLFAQALASSSKPLTIITNSLGVVNALGGQAGVRMILCPGDFSARERGVYGAETIAFLSRFNVDGAYIGASGVMPEGPVDAETDACWVKRTMIARANAAYLLADSSKFEKPFFETVCPWGDLTGFVVNARLPAKLAAPASKAGVEIYVAD